MFHEPIYEQSIQFPTSLKFYLWQQEAQVIDSYLSTPDLEKLVDLNSKNIDFIEP